MATGLVFAAGGAGAATVSLMLSAVIKRAGVPWAMRTFGICTLACCLPCVCRFPRPTSADAPFFRASYFLRARFTGVGAGKLDLHLFKTIQFSLLFVAGLLSAFPVYVVFFLPSFTRTLGYPESTGAWLLAIYSVSSAAGRLLVGIASDSFLGRWSPSSVLYATNDRKQPSIAWSSARPCSPSAC
jgi:hypothetical protein